jgi:quinol monooxygenase YgiN
MLTLIAKFTIQAGTEQAFEAKARTVVPKVGEESGNHAYIQHLHELGWTCGQ